MDTDKEALSFGRYLKAARLEKGISIEELSSKTMISVNSLILIERDDIESLPSKVFVKGFLCAYAEVVEADSEKVIKLYYDSLDAARKVSGSDPVAGKTGTSFRGRFGIALGILFFIIGLTVFVINKSKKKPFAYDTEKMKISENASLPNQENILHQPLTSMEPGPVSEKVLPEKIHLKYLLQINTVEDTWLKVIIDDKGPQEYSLKPGDRLEFEASYSLNLLIGNAAGVKLVLNDTPLNVLGKSGQVAAIKIP